MCLYSIRVISQKKKSHNIFHKLKGKSPPYFKINKITPRPYLCFSSLILKVSYQKIICAIQQSNC